MPRELEPSLNTKNFTLEALQKNLRLDSRALNETRPLKLTFGENVGCSYVELGKTKFELSIQEEIANEKSHGTSFSLCGKTIRGFSI